MGDEWGWGVRMRVMMGGGDGGDEEGCVGDDEGDDEGWGVMMRVVWVMMGG